MIGNAPQGGRLDNKSLIEIEKAIGYGCDIISGMHSLLKKIIIWLIKQKK